MKTFDSGSRILKCIIDGFKLNPFYSIQITGGFKNIYQPKYSIQNKNVEFNSFSVAKLHSMVFRKPWAAILLARKKQH